VKLRTATTAAVLAGMLLLAGCGSDSDDGGDSPETTESAAPSREPGGGFDEGQLEEIQACLEAAGLDDALPDRPEGMPEDLPSEPPSDAPTAPPEDLPSGGPEGGGLGALQDPEVQEALEACGIDLPAPPDGATE